ncbi:ABC transporter, partial [Citrobacter braakii]|nr:ABC transporter [Citrobacter braakii]
ELVVHGPTAAVLTEANLLRARQLQEAFDDTAEVCDLPDPGAVPHAAEASHGH